MKSMPFFTMLLLCLLASSAQPQQFQYVFGSQKYSVPSMSQPAKGVPFQDPQFNTTHVRVSDKLIDDYGRSFMTNIYSTVNIETADGKYVLLGDFNIWLYEIATSKLIKRLDLIHDGSDPEIRPDPFDPNIIYYLVDTIFYKYDLRDDSSVIVHDFKQEYPNAQWAQSESQGDPSSDARYWAFEIGRWDPQPIGTTGIDIVVYDKQTDTITSRFSENYSPINVRWASMSPSGERVLIKMWDVYFCENSGACGNGNIRTRLISFDRNFQNPVAIRGANGHADKAVTLDGRDVMVYQHTNDDWVSMAYLETGQVVNLIKIDFTQGSTGFHFSGNNYTRPGWALVSTYGVTQDWQNKQLYMIELKENPRIWRLAHTRAQPDPSVGKDYWAEALATISRSGTKVWWASNWGNYQNRLETYQITLPVTWWEELSGVTTPPVLSFPADNATNVSTNPSLAWSSSSGATSYRLQVSTNSNFLTTVVDQSGLPSTSFQVSSVSNSTGYFWRVNVTNTGGTSLWSTVWQFTTEPVTSVEAASEIPGDFRLGQNYPNPFNPTTNITFDLPKSEYVSLKIYTLLGVEVATLVSENFPAGEYTIKFDASRLSSGVFFYKLQTSSFVETRKMLLVR